MAIQRSILGLISGLVISISILVSRETMSAYHVNVMSLLVMNHVFPSLLANSNWITQFLDLISILKFFKRYFDPNFSYLKN